MSFNKTFETLDEERAEAILKLTQQDYTSPVSINAICAALGIRVYPQNFTFDRNDYSYNGYSLKTIKKTENMLGYIDIYDKDDIIIIYRKELSLKSSRLLVAYLLARYLLNFAYQDDYTYIEYDYKYKSKLKKYKLAETEATKLAMALLLPLYFFDGYKSHKKLTPEAKRRLSDKFQVPISVIEYRYKLYKKMYCK